MKLRSALYARTGEIRRLRPRQPARLVRAFDDDPARINRLEDEFAKVTPAVLQKTAQEYLRPGNRTDLHRDPRREARCAGGGCPEVNRKVPCAS